MHRRIFKHLAEKIKTMEVTKFIAWVLFYFINGILAFYFLLPVLLFIISYFIKKTTHPAVSNQNIKENQTDFAAIVTTHQDTRFIPPLVDSFFKQSHTNFTLYIVADDCHTDDLHFEDKRVVILKPEPALHSKIKSINYAMDHFLKPHQVMVIFDSDNLVHPDFFNKLQGYFNRGFKVVQTHMLSKNTESTFARLDSVGHIYYTFTERKVKMDLGMHSAILGLGIALDTELYKEIRYKDTIGGFDKKLQSQLAIKVKQIAFAEDAIVYDEKIEEGDALEKQRTRWIYTYFKHFKDSWNLFIAGVKTLSIGRILLGCSMLRPPMFLLLFAAFIMMILSAFIKPPLFFWWMALLLIYALNFILIIATQSLQKGMLESLIFIPLLITRQLKSLLKIKTAKSSFLKTEHKKIIYIDDLLKNEPV
jgi:cellulose synthase/poly-beta-1,6-N-acetylglucosamine synthase-like glycosyltransferase